jgi:hypothetical protein
VPTPLQQRIVLLHVAIVGCSLKLTLFFPQLFTNSRHSHFFCVLPQIASCLYLLLQCLFISIVIIIFKIHFQKIFFGYTFFNRQKLDIRVDMFHWWKLVLYLTRVCYVNNVLRLLFEDCSISILLEIISFWSILCYFNR